MNPNPYLTAFEQYQTADREVSWTEAMDFHAQYGAVVSTPDYFVMARPVRFQWPDECHAALVPLRHGRETDTWHVWAVAGDLMALLDLAKRHKVDWLTYQRHGLQAVRRLPTCAIRQRLLAR